MFMRLGRHPSFPVFCGFSAENIPGISPCEITRQLRFEQPQSCQDFERKHFPLTPASVFYTKRYPVCTYGACRVLYLVRRPTIWFCNVQTPYQQDHPQVEFW